MNPAAQEVLSDIRARGLQLTAVGHRLRAVGPTKALDDDLRQRLAEHRSDILELILSEHVPPTEPFAVTNVQQRMHLNTEKSTADDHVRAVFQLRGPIDESILSSAAQALTQKHPSLRMQFHQDEGRLTQALGPQTKIEVERVPLSNGTPPIDSLRNFTNRPFRIGKEPLFKIGLTDEAEDQTRLLAIVVHHALADAQALGILLADLAGNYAAFKSGGFPDTEGNQTPFLTQLRVFNKRCTHYDEDHVQEWVDALGADTRGSLPRCDEGIGAATEPRFERFELMLDPSQKKQVDQFLVQESTSLLAMLLATTSILVTRSTGEGNCTVGLSVSDRRHADLEQAVANLAIDLPVRIDVPADSTVRSVLDSCQRAVFTSLDRPTVPLEAILRQGVLPPLGRRGLRLPIAVASYEPRDDPFEFEGVDVERLDDTHPNPFIGLALRLVNTTDTLTLLLEWDESLLTTERAKRLGRMFLDLVVAMTTDVSRPVSELPFDEELCEGVILTPIEQVGQEIAPGKPHSLVESALASTWTEILGVCPIQLTDRFFALGGNSLQVIRAIDSIHATFGVTLSIADFMGDPTLAELAGKIEDNSKSIDIPPTIWLTKDRDQPIVFCLAGVGGLAAFTYQSIAEKLEGIVSLIGVQLPGVGAPDETRGDVHAMAEWVKETILEKAPKDQSIRLVGFSAGGVIAIEAANQLTRAGHELEPVVLIDTLAPLAPRKRGPIGMAQAMFRRVRLAHRMKKELDKHETLKVESTGGHLEQRLRTSRDRTRLAIIRHTTEEFDGAIKLICSRSPRNRIRQEAWRNIARRGFETQTLPMYHLKIMTEGADTICTVIQDTYT